MPDSLKMQNDLIEQETRDGMRFKNKERNVRTIRDCNVCVVGGAGFLGSHLVDHLIDDRGCEVLVIDNLVAGRREFIHPKAEFVHHDITGSEEHLNQLFRMGHSNGSVDYVFNYAAYPYVPDSFSRPLHVFNVNVNGAIKVINAAQEAGCKGVLQVSSAELYGAGVFDGKTPETSIVEPHSTYGVTKLAVDYYCQTAWRERKTPVIALRQFNCVGERETHPYIVPEVISQLALCQDVQEEANIIASKIRRPGFPLIKLGNNSFRDFLYAGDAVRIAVELLEWGSWGEVYNLGSETGIKMYDLAKLIGKLMGFSDVKVEEDETRKRPWEIWHLQSDNTKLFKQVYGSTWPNFVDCPQVPLEEALKRTITYYESNGRKWCWEK